MKPTGLPSYTSFTYVLDEFLLLASTGSCSECSEGVRYKLPRPWRKILAGMLQTEESGR